MRLLYGTVVSDCKWLTFGDGPAAAQKHFQFGAESIITVHVKGQFLRAGNQPLEGHLASILTPATITVIVRADVPITPFADGILAGSDPPRADRRESTCTSKRSRRPVRERAWSPNGSRRMAGYIRCKGQMSAAWAACSSSSSARPGQATEGRSQDAEFAAQGRPRANPDSLHRCRARKKRNMSSLLRSAIRPWVVPGLQPKETKNPMVRQFPLTIQCAVDAGPTQQAKIMVTANGNQKFPVAADVEHQRFAGRLCAGDGHPALGRRGLTAPYPSWPFPSRHR